MAVCRSHSEDLAEAEAFAGAVARRASAALSKRRTRSEAFSIGSLRFKLVAPAANADRWLGRAFLKAPEYPSSSGRGSNRLVVWDGTCAEELPPARPWLSDAIEPLGVVSSHSNEAVRCAVDIHTNSLIVYNFAENSSYTWFPDIPSLPTWAQASPFRVNLSWLCNCHGMQIVHGAAVGMHGRAVLLAGKGGAGKSTTALACALAGMDYLGDDYCTVEPAAGKIHMVYRTAKLFKSSLDLVPAVATLIENADQLNVEKGVIFFEPSDVKLARSAELSAILLPRVDGKSAATLFPATRDEAIKAILPSTVGGLMGGTSVTPRLLMQLARSVPVFHLNLGGDVKAVTNAIASRLTAG